MSDATTDADAAVDLYWPGEVLEAAFATELTDPQRVERESDSCCASTRVGPAASPTTVDVYLSRYVDGVYQTLDQGWSLTVRTLTDPDPVDAESTVVLETVVHSLAEVRAALAEHAVAAYRGLL